MTSLKEIYILKCILIEFTKIKNLKHNFFNFITEDYLFINYVIHTIKNVTFIKNILTIKKF